LMAPAAAALPSPTPSPVVSLPRARGPAGRLGGGFLRPPPPCHAAQRAFAARAAASGGDGTLLWFKHDLRTIDHPGLAKVATSEGAVTPVFCFDPALAARATPSEMQYTWEAVQALKQALRAAGSDLAVLKGSPADVLPVAAAAAGAGRVLAEAELSPTWGAAAAGARAALTDAGVEYGTWDIQLRPWGDNPPISVSPVMDPNVVSMEGVPELRAGPRPEFNYTAALGSFDYGGAAHPAPPLEVLPAPGTLQAAALGLGGGDVTCEEARAMAGAEDPPIKKLDEKAVTARLEELVKTAAAAAEASRSVRDPWAQAAAAEALASAKDALKNNDASALPSDYVLKGGEPVAVEALAQFLRFYVPRPASEMGAEEIALRAAVQRFFKPADGCVDGAFSALFGDALLNGCLSPRYSVSQAIQFEQADEARARSIWYYDGPVNPRTGLKMHHVFGMPTVKSVVAKMELEDYYAHVARAQGK